MRTVRVVLRAAKANRDGQRLYRCIRVHKRFSNAANTSSPVARSLRADYMNEARGLRVIGSSEQVHVVDALAITGDEGRRSLR